MLHIRLIHALSTVRRKIIMIVIKYEGKKLLLWIHSESVMSYNVENNNK